MALISIKNLVAPASNTVHMVSIALTVIAFTAWRMSGGDLKFSSSLNSSVPQRTESRSFNLDSLNVQETMRGNSVPRAVATRNVGTVTVDRDEALDLFAIQQKQAASGRPKAGEHTAGDRGAGERNVGERGSGEHGSGANALADIERSLGLR